MKLFYPILTVALLAVLATTTLHSPLQLCPEIIGCEQCSDPASGKC